MQSVTTIKAKWYDPAIWPRWVRWCATVIVPLLVAIVVYVVYDIVNNIVPMVPSAVTSLFAALIAAYAYVVSGRIIAPSSRRFIGYTLALIALIFVGYFIGVIVTKPTSSMPAWYGVLFGLVGAAGAVFGAFIEMPDRDAARREFYAFLPTPLRWALFLPIAIVLSFLVDFALGIPLALMHLNSEVIKLVNTPLSMAVFIGVAAAVAPRAKGLVGVTLGAIFTAIALIGLFITADRPLAAQIISHALHRNPDDFVWSTSVWYQTLSFTSVLLASVIAAWGSVDAERQRKVDAAAM